MINIKTSKQIRTIRHLKSFRSCRTATGVSMAHLDRGRIYREEMRLANRELRRQWLEGVWESHLNRCAQRKG
ncbi:MAG: hypothetical protein V1694_00470 [Candidatus Eisenbacteria bacterium]